MNKTITVAARSRPSRASAPLMVPAAMASAHKAGRRRGVGGQHQLWS
jgi:hypothetical protein